MDVHAVLTEVVFRFKTVAKNESQEYGLRSVIMDSVRAAMREVNRHYVSRLFRVTRFCVNCITSVILEGYVNLFWKRLYKRRVPNPLPEPLVVSLTSYPPRFAKLALTLKALLSQSVRPDQLVLWIAKADYSKLTNDVLALKAYGVIIKTCDDFRSYKKIIPLLLEQDDCCIVTADDDAYYQRGWLKEFVDSYQRGRGEVICGRARLMTFDENGAVKPYMQWRQVEGRMASSLVFPTGVGGILYPPGIFHKDVTRVDLFKTYCPSADDIWLYWMAAINGAIFKRIGSTGHPPSWLGSQKSMLTKYNVNEGGNDKQIANMIAIYGVPPLKGCQ